MDYNVEQIGRVRAQWMLLTTLFLDQLHQSPAAHQGVNTYLMQLDSLEYGVVEQVLDNAQVLDSGRSLSQTPTGAFLALSALQGKIERSRFNTSGI
jgi:hypothetical protein